jgi:nucleoid DNA-binding protein
MAKKNAAPTKSEILAQISKDTGLAKKQVSDVFESLSGVVNDVQGQARQQESAHRGAEEPQGDGELSFTAA